MVLAHFHLDMFGESLVNVKYDRNVIPLADTASIMTSVTLTEYLFDNIAVTNPHPSTSVQGKN